MIESRYSIEYIDPSSERKPSKLGKFLIYSVLTLSIITAIVALIFSNLSTSASQDISAKVQSFIRSFNTVSIPAPANDEALNEETLNLQATTAIISKKYTQDELSKQKKIASQRESELKEEIDRLSQENSTQHEETVEQLQTNRILKEKLEQLSKQLENEELKSSQLADKVTNLSEKNKSVSVQLKEKTQTIDDYANEIKKLENRQTAVIETIPPSTSVSSSDTITKVVKKPEEKVVTKPINNKITKNIIEIKEEKPKISQMDAIIAAMEAEKNSSTTENTKAASSSDKN